MNYKYEQYKKNMEILSGFEKVAKEIGLKNGGEKAVSFEIKDKDGNLTKVSKEEFAWWMVNEKNNDNWVGGVFSLESKNSEIEEQKNKENKLIENDIKDNKQVEKPQESLVYGASGDIDSITYFSEIRNKDGVVKETYHQPRSEEEKKQIIERNKKRREEERQKKTSITASQDKEGIDLNELTKEINQKNTQTEISPNSDNKDQKSEQETNQISSFQNKDNNISKKVYWGIGIFSLLVLVGAIVISKCKQKKV